MADSRPTPTVSPDLVPTDADSGFCTCTVSVIRGRVAYLKYRSAAVQLDSLCVGRQVHLIVERSLNRLTRTDTITRTHTSVVKLLARDDSDNVWVQTANTLYRIQLRWGNRRS